MAAIKNICIEASGLRFAARTLGSGPLVLCLHGFPDSAHTWDALLPKLAAAGYRAVAPFMRGYAPTQVPADNDYSVATLGLDVLALADALGEKKFYIVGHDWGAITAYSSAAYAPHRVRGIVTAAVPPLRRFLLGITPAQLKRSWYIGFFQLPWLPESRMRRNDCALVDRLWRSWSPDWDYAPEDIAPVKGILGRPANCRAALNYYRALRGVFMGPRRNAERRRILGKLDVPALVIYGKRDGCIGSDVFAGTQGCFTQACELVSMPSGHFMHREQPAAFNAKVMEFLATQAG